MYRARHDDADSNSSPASSSTGDDSASSRSSISSHSSRSEENAAAARIMQPGSISQQVMVAPDLARVGGDTYSPVQATGVMGSNVTLGSAAAAGEQNYPIPVPQALTSAQLMVNSPNDEVYSVDENHHIATPVKIEQSSLMNRAGVDRLSTNVYRSAQGTLGSNSIPTAAAGGVTLMTDNPNDERIDVSDAEVVPTPRVKSSKPPQASERELQAQRGREFHSSGNGSTSNTDRAFTQRLGQSHQRDGRSGSDEAEEEEEEDEELEENEDEGEEEDLDEDDQAGETEEKEYRAEGYAGQRPDTLDENINSATTSPTSVATSINLMLAYDPAKYEKVNAKASREMQDLFRQIAEYNPFIAELPAKLRPFIPDYIPAIGDMDPFVKVGRPDGRPDGLGLYVVDEPTIPQSNPAVVQLELRATSVQGSSGAAMQVVDSFEDAENRPQVIDRWIADVKKVHYKKPLPTITYQKPMPEVEWLMQVWPQVFEDLLNSDLQLPPPSIDLDMDQYVRTLCSILDIPTYNTLIDSLHVMFTLYEEFRDNQHFQH